MRLHGSSTARMLVALSVCLLAPSSCRAGQAEPPKDAPPAAAKDATKGKAMPKEYLSEADKKELLRIARDTIETYVRTGKKPPVKTASKPLLDKGAAFVTLKKHGDLRGCIGDIIAHQPLVDSIQGNAVNAATHDPRFDPVQPGELAAIDIEISVLTPMQPVADWKEIVVGQDGVLLLKGMNRGVFLPQVPTEQGWNLQQYLDNLARKAGLPYGQWKDAKLEKFQAIVFGEKE